MGIWEWVMNGMFNIIILKKRDREWIRLLRIMPTILVPKQVRTLSIQLFYNPF